MRFARVATEVTVMAKWSWFLIAVLAGSAVSAITTVQAAEEAEEKENEQPVSLDQIPAPAREALLREAAGDPIVNVVQETEQGQTVYEAHVRRGGGIIGISVNAKGDVLERESEKGEKSK
jgi:hypothetical protein